MNNEVYLGQSKWFTVFCIFFLIHVLETPFLNIDCCQLKDFDADLYRQLVCYPQEVIPTFDMAANEIFFEKYPDAQLEHQIQVISRQPIMTNSYLSQIIKTEAHQRS